MTNLTYLDELMAAEQRLDMLAEATNYRLAKPVTLQNKKSGFARLWKALGYLRKFLSIQLWKRYPLIAFTDEKNNWRRD